MRKIINLITASMLLISTVYATPAAFAAAPDGSNTLNLHTGDRVTISRVSRDQYFMTHAGRPIETNVYQISGGNGVDQFMYCLEHGSGYAPGNAVMNINDAYSWQADGSYENGVLYNETTNQPVPTANLQITLKSGYTLSGADIFALDTIYQNSYTLKNRINIGWAEVSYASQNAIRAYVTDVAGVTWGAESVSYAGGSYYDGSGRLCVGSVKARSVSENDVLSYSYELYKLAIRAKAEAKVISESRIQLTKVSEDKCADLTTIQIRVNTGGSDWQISSLCKAEIESLGGKIDKEKGKDGETFTFSVQNESLEGFILDVRTRETRGSGNLYFALPQNTAYQKMIGMNTIINDNKQATMKFKLLGDSPDDIPLPVVPDFIFRGNKTDQEPGFDNNSQSGRGDALLNAGFEVYIDGVYRTTFYADKNGLNGISDPQEIWRVEDLTPDVRYHSGSGLPNRVTYDVTAVVRIKEIVPTGYLPGTGDREFAIRYQARTQRSIHWQSDGDGGGWWIVEPWDEYEYHITPDGGWNDNTEDRKQNEVRFVNLVKKGHIHINKTIEKDFDPWGDTPATKIPMEGAKFTIRLVGHGSESHPYLRAVKITAGQPGYDPWANCYRVVKDGSGTAMDGKSGDNSFFITSEFGQIKIFDIPWGTYQLDEVSAKTAGYVLEHTSFIVNYDGQILSKDIVDYVIRDELVVCKVDAETGKRIPSDKMAFRLRYMGNPNTAPADRQDDKNYGKYLSAKTGNSGAETYTFFTDANGKCVFPYPLQYGEYQLEELVAPDGYYIDEHIAPDDYPYLIHKFTIDKMGENPFEHPVVELKIKNNPVKGQIEIIKTGESISGFKKINTEYGVLNQPVFENVPKNGVSFDIYAKSDIKLPDGIDAPLFVDRNGGQIALDTTLENHALWKNAVRTQEKIMPDGTALSITTERYPDDLRAMAKANLLTATNKPNKYTLEYSAESDGFTENYSYDVVLEYTPDGYVVSEIKGVKRTEYKGIALSGENLFPGNAYFEIASGGESAVDIADYANLMFKNKNEASIEYLYELKLVKSGETLLITPPTDYNIKYEGFGTGYLTYTDSGKTEFYTAMWTDENQTEQVFVKHSNSDKNFAKYCLTKDVRHIAPEEHTYAVLEWEFEEGEGEPLEYFVTEWINIPDEGEYPELSGFLLMEERLTQNGQIMFEQDGEYLIFAEVDDKPQLIPCSGHGEFFDTKLEAFSATLYKSPVSSSEIVFIHDNGFSLTLYSDHSGGKAEITKPQFSARPLIELDENTEMTGKDDRLEFTIPVTVPTVFMELNDGTRVGLVYSGGFAFTTIEVPLGNEYPVCFYEGAERSLTSNEQGDVLSPFSPILDLLAPDPSGDRITAELITPPVSRGEYTVFRIATKRKDAGGIVFNFPDGRKMEVSTKTDQNGKTRGHAAITCFTPTYRYLLGEFVERVTTGDSGDGKAVSSLLPLGGYVIRESGATKGVLVEDGDYEVSLDYQGNYVPLVWESTFAENKMAAMQLNVKKVFQESVKSGVYVPKAGAVFGVFTNEEISGLKKDSLIGVIISGKDGAAEGVFKAPFGEYYLKELKTLPGYELNPYIYPFTYDDEAAESPLKTQFADKGVVVEYRYVSEQGSQVVVKTLKQIPQISYKINGISIDTKAAKTKSAGKLLIKEEITAIDHIAVISNIGKSVLRIEFEDGDVAEYKAKDKGFGVVITQPETICPVEVQQPAAHSVNVDMSAENGGKIVTSVDFSLGLNNIRYKAVLGAEYDKDIAKPTMKIGDTLLYRETSTNAGTDKLVVLNLSDDSKITAEVNSLPEISTMEISDEDVVMIERSGKTLSLTLLSGYAEVGDRAGLQPDGSLVEHDPTRITYFVKDLTINDTENSSESVHAKLDAVYAGGELIFNNAPLSAYKDGVPVLPEKSMLLDKMACYTFLLSDGTTRAEAVLMPDNTLNMTLDGKKTSDFDSFKAPVLESQGEKSLVVDKQGSPFIQTAAQQMKTIDKMTYFVSESRTYARADAFAPVTRIELNTADGVMQGILNDLSGTHPGGPSNSITNDPPDKAAGGPEEEPGTEVHEGDVPLDKIEMPAEVPEPDIPKTEVNNGILWLYIALIASTVTLLLMLITANFRQKN